MELLQIHRLNCDMGPRKMMRPLPDSQANGIGSCSGGHLRSMSSVGHESKFRIARSAGSVVTCSSEVVL